MKKRAKEVSIQNEERSFRKYLLLGIVLLLVFISYRIVEPYIIVLISSFLLAYLSRPLFNFLKPRFGPGLSAFLCLSLVLIIFILPAVFVVTSLASQASLAVENTDITAVVDKITSLPYIDKINVNWDSAIEKVTYFIFSLVSTIAGKLPGLLISMLIFLFSFFYILIGWSSLTRQVKRFIPFKEKDRIAREINQETHGIIFGYLLVALLDFVVCAIGFYFAGVKFYLLLSFIVAALVFIPGLGPSIVNLPLLVYFAINQNWYGFILVAITWLVVGLIIETIISPKLLAGRAKIHPLVMLIGILGGTTLFGLFGFIIGPLVLIYTIKIIKELAN
jgi:predicted PurR-regulated permease PerM